MSALLPGLYSDAEGHHGILDRDGDFSYLNSDGYHCTWRTNELKPLIVLDLDTAEREYIGDLRYVADRLPEHNVHRALVHNLADMIEAQCKPARIPEPGLWGVVEASDHTFLRVKCDFGGQWRDLTMGGSFHWTDLIDPTLIREGVTS